MNILGMFPFNMYSFILSSLLAQITNLYVIAAKSPFEAVSIALQQL